MITGAGRAFSSGADLKDFSGGHDARGAARRLQDADRALPPDHAARSARCPSRCVASVNGPAVGIGCSLALCCDLIVAAESAYFLLAFVNIGLVPDGGSSLFVPTRVGMARATELAMLGERLPAPKALEWGLINRVVPDERLAGGDGGAGGAAGRRPDALLRRHQAPAQQLAVRAHGRAARARGADSSRRWPSSDDFLEGAMAFVEKRARALLRAAEAGGRGHRHQAPSRVRGLNRIPAALGHLISTTLAFFTPQSGGSPNANQIDSLYKITLYIALVIFVLVEGALVYALVKLPRAQGRGAPRRSAATRAWRSAGRSAPR